MILPVRLFTRFHTHVHIITIGYLSIGMDSVHNTLAVPTSYDSGGNKLSDKGSGC